MNKPIKINVSIINQIFALAVVISGVTILLLALFTSVTLEKTVFPWMLGILALAIICMVVDITWRFFHRPAYLKAPSKFAKHEWKKFIIANKKKKRKEHQNQLRKDEQRRLHNRSSVMATKKHNRIYHKLMSFDESKKAEFFTNLIFIIICIISAIIVIYFAFEAFNIAFHSSNNETSEPIRTKGWVITQETIFKIIFSLVFLLGIILAMLSIVWPSAHEGVQNGHI